ncbi:MAG: VacB/RNase II family 3'-5' exoribonuclease [Alphaproteobacteria bacterium]|nr:VacB/RNase II family 3'-5' exoribonuclease [Alphaproteobacteria bacterium]MDP7221672.1 VacB/RNase II family 3'-5' exoribonuclease [Alphaproteobacteria bacterium]
MSKTEQSPVWANKNYMYWVVEQIEGEVTLNAMCEYLGIDPKDKKGQRKTLKAVVDQMIDEGLLRKIGTTTYEYPKDLPQKMNQLYPVKEVIDGEEHIVLKAEGWEDSKDYPFPLVTADDQFDGDNLDKIGYVKARLFSCGDGTYVANVFDKGNRNQMKAMRAEREERQQAQLRNDALGGAFNAAASGKGSARMIGPEYGFAAPTKKGGLSGKLNKKARRVQHEDTLLEHLLEQHESRASFPQEILDMVADYEVPELDDTREDLRDVPLFTCDPIDARDFDDAIFAEPDTNPNNPGGFHLIVAIADVAHYVHSGDKIDVEARRRGNSVYLPDKVIPMLPKALSNNLCSLVPNEDRAAMAMHMWINKKGELVDYNLRRALINSHARLHYDQLQDAMDGNPDETCAPLMDDIISPVIDAFKVLRGARKRRQALDVNLEEVKVYVDDDTNKTIIKHDSSVESHHVVEEMMILANVAAASILEDSKAPCVYRVHKDPIKASISRGLEELKQMGVRGLPKEVKTVKDFYKIIDQAKGVLGDDAAKLAVVRMQSRAAYSPYNQGHYGLALERYAHFTSPIRRYSDLIVHRSLVSLLELGLDGLSEYETKNLSAICEHISETEREADKMEKLLKERFMYQALADMQGEDVEATITDIGIDGIAVRLKESRLETFVPMEVMPKTEYSIGSKGSALVSEKDAFRFKIGNTINVKIDDVDTEAKMVFVSFADAEEYQAALDSKMGHKRQPS